MKSSSGSVLNEPGRILGETGNPKENSRSRGRILETNQEKDKDKKQSGQKSKTTQPQSTHPTVTGNPWKIALPDNMLTNLVNWHHSLTMHSEGFEKLYATLSLRFTHPHLKRTCRKITQNCDICKRMKVGQRQYGKLAPRTAPFLPWSEVHVDDVGPWSVEVNGHEMKFHAMTMVDPVFNLLEVNLRTGTKSEETARVFRETWLCRYPRPFRCVNDNGPAYQGDFQTFLLKAGIKLKPITSYTPTANSIIEATHKMVAQVIRTLVHLNPPK